MAHTFINISFEDPDGAVLTATIDGEVFTPDGWTAFTITNSVEEVADFGASAGDFIESCERYEAHWTGLSTYVAAYEDPVNPVELEFASFNTGIDATTFESFEREWSSNESYLFGFGASASASFDCIAPQNFEDVEEEWGAAIHSVTFTNATNRVNETAHGLTSGDRIVFAETANVGDTLPATPGFTFGVCYQVVNETANDFQLEPLGGGGAIAFTDDGTGAPFELWDLERANNAYDFTLGATSPAAFDPVTGTEDFEDFEEEWSDNHNYDFVMGATSAAMFEGGTQPLDDYEETNFNQWTVVVVTATALADYTITVEGEPRTFTAGGAPTVTTIRDGLITALGGSSKQIVVVTAGSNGLRIARDSAIQEPARNSFLPVAVDGPTAGDLTKSPTSKDEWTQTGQMATDP